MYLTGDLPLVPISEALVSSYAPNPSPEMQLLLCLGWVANRSSRSKNDGETRLKQIFMNSDWMEGLSKTVIKNFSDSDSIQSAARHFNCQAALLSSDVTYSFGSVAELAKEYRQTAVVAIYWTERGFVYPVVAYQSAGKFKGVGSHLYMFLPLLGEIKIAPSEVAEKIVDGIHVPTHITGKLGTIHAYLVGKDLSGVTSAIATQSKGGSNHSFVSFGGGSDQAVAGASIASRPALPKEPPPT